MLGAACQFEALSHYPTNPLLLTSPLPNANAARSVSQKRIQTA